MKCLTCYHGWEQKIPPQGTVNCPKCGKPVYRDGELLFKNGGIVKRGRGFTEKVEKYYVIINHRLEGYSFSEFDTEEEAIKSIDPFSVADTTFIKGTEMSLSLKVGSKEVKQK